MRQNAQLILTCNLSKPHPRLKLSVYSLCGFQLNEKIMRVS